MSTMSKTASSKIPSVAQSPSPSWEKKMCATIYDSNAKKFKKILESKAVSKHGNLSRKEWKRDEAPLHAAAFWGQNTVIGALVAAGINVDSVEVHGDGSRFTPLHRAVLANLKETVSLLLKLRADATLVGKYWEKAPGTPQQQQPGMMTLFYAGSALDFARQKGHQDIAKLLEAHLAKDSSLTKKSITLSDVKAQASKERELQGALAIQDLMNAKMQLFLQLHKEMKTLESKWNTMSVEVLAMKQQPGYRSERQIHLLSQHLERVQAMATALKEVPTGDEALRRSCPVCFDAPGQVFSCVKCENWVCGRCKVKLEACPSCRDASEPPRRNKGIERVLGI